MIGRSWAAVTPVSDLGQKAFFRDNRGELAELAVLAAGRVLTFQMDVPRGKTAAVRSGERRVPGESRGGQTEVSADSDHGRGGGTNRRD